MSDVTLDFTGMTDEELEQIRTDVSAEIDKRLMVAGIPERMTQMYRLYVESGGDPAELDFSESDTGPKTEPIEVV